MFAGDESAQGLSGERRPRRDALIDHPIQQHAKITAIGVQGVRGRAPLDPQSAQIIAYRRAQGRRGVRVRSEEHTSELQSLMRISYAVFFLKKTTETQPM